MSLVPFDPNGMCFDLLRSCSTQAIFYVDGDTSFQEQARWYFCAPGALPFPSWHAFGSPVWDTEHPTVTTLGFDATSPRVYDRGRRTNASDGTRFAGPIEFFQQGCMFPQNLPRGSSGTPVVCLDRPEGLALGGQAVPVNVARGGLLLGGQAVTTIAPGVPCSSCPGVTPSTVSMTVAGFTGLGTIFNGTWTIPQTASPCVWQLNFGGGAFIQVTRTAGTWTVLFDPPVKNATYSGVSVDCVTPTVMTQSFSNIGGPATFVLQMP